MQVNREYEDLRGDGQIMLFLRNEGKKPNYYVRVSIPKSTGYKTVSTKTKNRNLAVKFAMDLYDEYNHVVQTGGSLHSKSYSALVLDGYHTTAVTIMESESLYGKNTITMVS